MDVIGLLIALGAIHWFYSLFALGLFITMAVAEFETPKHAVIKTIFIPGWGVYTACRMIIKEIP